MKVVWVTRSFLDYRIPVYKELNLLLNGNLFIVYNEEYIPDRVNKRIKEELGKNAIGLKGEFKIGPDDFGDFLANKKIRIPFQPKLIRTIKKMKPDILISDGFFQWTYAALWLRCFHGTPHLMCYERTKHTERNAQWFRILFRKFASRFIDKYCASGKLCGEYLKELGVLEENISYGHMVADISGMKNSLKRVENNDKRTYLYVGKLIERKGIRQLLDCWRNFEKGKEFKVVLKIVGEGELNSYLKNYLLINKIETIQLLGHVDYSKMNKVYSDADIFIIPTLEDNWSLVVPEAMANGLPILCSSYNGCWPEYVTKDNGWVFDPLNEENFISKLNESFDVNNLQEYGGSSAAIIKNYTSIHAAKSLLRAINSSC